MIGVVTKVQGNEVTLVTDTPIDLAEARRKTNHKIEYEMTLKDTRQISQKQRGMIYGLIRDISDYTGEPAEWWEDRLKIYFKEYKGLDTFSLKTENCSVQRANEFIEEIIRFCFANEIPFKDRKYHIDAHTERILFLYLINRTCMVCGKPHADIAHVEAVGMGRDRNTIDHASHRFLSLCREHHTAQHIMGIDSFMEMYHLVPIKVDEKVLRELGVL